MFTLIPVGVFRFADVPCAGFHHQVGHPSGRSLARHRALVVQDKDLVLADFRHKVEMLLQTQKHGIGEPLGTSQGTDSGQAACT